MESIEEGDVVKLKSGGPKMTVQGSHQYDKDSAVCAWFDGTEQKSETFRKGSLVKVEDEE